MLAVMSRDIKFRAYMPSEKAMCSWEFLLTEIGHYENVFEETDDWKPMQYTGLKDKNGVEIYEGDIVVAPLCDPQAVTWSNEGAYFDANDLLDGITTGGELKVIGNIYENKELLNKQGDK